MELHEAIRKFKIIEKHIKELKKAGCSVTCVDSEKLVLETPDTWKKNEIAFHDEFLAYQKAQERDCYGRHMKDVGEYDYEIFLI